MVQRMGKHQKMLLSYLYQNGAKSLIDFVIDNSLGIIQYSSTSQRIMAYETMKPEARDLVIDKWNEEDKGARNLYFTLWNAIKILKNAGFIIIDKRSYHYYRKIHLTEKAIKWLETERKDIIGLTWAERANERCKKCVNWGIDRMDEDGDVFKASVEGCFHNYDIKEWNCGYYKDRIVG